MYKLEELNEKTLKWAEERGITVNGKATTQCLKLMSELGELADNIIKGKDVKDDIGDMLVVLCNIAELTGTNLEESWNVAYEDIKDRKGFLNEHGNFIKDTTDEYDEMYAEFLNGKKKEPKCVSLEQRPYDGFGVYEWAVLFDDNSREKISFSVQFQEKYPEGPMGMTKKFIMANN